MTWCRNFFLIFVSLIFGFATAGEYEDEQAAYQKQEYEAAAKIFTSLAKDGDAKAQNDLGLMYQLALGVDQNYDAAAARLILSQLSIVANEHYDSVLTISLLY